MLLERLSRCAGVFDKHLLAVRCLGIVVGEVLVVCAVGIVHAVIEVLFLFRFELREVVFAVGYLQCRIAFDLRLNVGLELEDRHWQKCEGLKHLRRERLLGLQTLGEVQAVHHVSSNDSPK